MSFAEPQQLFEKAFRYFYFFFGKILLTRSYNYIKYNFIQDRRFFMRKKNYFIFILRWIIEAVASTIATVDGRVSRRLFHADRSRSAGRIQFPQCHSSAEERERAFRASKLLISSARSWPLVSRGAAEARKSRDTLGHPLGLCPRGQSSLLINF